MKKLLLVFALLMCWQKVLAQSQDVAGNDPRADNYYTVNDEPASQAVSGSQQLDPLHSAQNLFSEAPQWMMEIKAQVLSLLQFTHHNENYGDVNEPYNRSKHFGTWVTDRNDGTCYNTRAKVLIRDSQTQVTFNSRGCTVVSGTWQEPYTGQEVYKASELQIDHLVPLKNAYVSGAYKWDYPKRCLYANFLGNSFHLISADGSQNMKKGDKTPQGYIPPNPAYSCQYLAQWLKIKLIWDLGLTPSEKDSVVSLISQNHCDLAQFRYSQQDLNQQRNFMAEHMDLCQ